MSKPSVGNHVYISGTGKWYAGEHFGAVVVDVREKDDSVKVRFTDGGYKRYNLVEFNSLLTQAKYTPQMPEEWSAQRSLSTADDGYASEMKQLHDAVMEAVKQGDFLKADEHQKKFKAMSAQHDEIQSLEINLIDTVNRGDFAGAHEIQTKLKNLKNVPATAITAATTTPAKPATVAGVFETAGKKALSGGLAGMSAMVLQVSTLMWMRTTMNYQYRYGMGTMDAMKTLYADGGIPRFYRGIGPALIQGPVSRFGDTAANAGVLALFEGNDSVKHWPAFAKTVFSSATAASMRIVLVPVDTVKTMMQVEGKEGLTKLRAKFAVGGVPVMFHGALATSAATFVGHYPWFTVFNTLSDTLPKYTETHKKLARNAFIGFCASATSDTISNSLRVVKTYRQTNDTMAYREIVSTIVEKDGWAGLFGRGLKTRILANGTQGIMFSVLFRLFEEKFNKS